MEHEGMLIPKGSTVVLHMYTMFHSHIRLVHHTRYIYFLLHFISPSLLPSLVMFSHLTPTCSHYVSLPLTPTLIFTHAPTPFSVNLMSFYQTVGTNRIPSTPSWKACLCLSAWANATVWGWIWRCLRWGDCHDSVAWHDMTWHDMTWQTPLE